MTPEREERIGNVAWRRQTDLTVVLENVHDPHNISAVLRTCDAVGIPAIYVLYTEPTLIEQGLELGHKSSSGTRKWVDVYYYTVLEHCMADVRKNFDRVLATATTNSTTSLYSADLTGSTAVIFGNEHDGISDEIRKYADEFITIPQVGMVESLNISVACAVCLFEAFRQRQEKGLYEMDESKKEQNEYLFREYLEKHSRKYKGKKPITPGRDVEGRL